MIQLNSSGKVPIIIYIKNLVKICIPRFHSITHEKMLTNHSNILVQYCFKILSITKIRLLAFCINLFLLSMPPPPHLHCTKFNFITFDTVDNITFASIIINKVDVDMIN